MQKKISYLMFVFVFLSVGLASCQSPEDKVAQAEKELRAYAGQTSKQDQQVKEFVESTPDLYRVSWKVCGDDKLSVQLKDKINKGCNETRNEPTEGYTSPAYVWGNATEAKFVNKRNFSPHFQSTGLFVKSTGCVNLGKPQEEKFYKVQQFTLKKGNNPPPTNIKVEVLSKQEKEEILRGVIAQAEIENASLRNFGVSSNGQIPTGRACPTLEQWKQES